MERDPLVKPELFKTSKHLDPRDQLTPEEQEIFHEFMIRFFQMFTLYTSKCLFYWELKYYYNTFRLGDFIRKNRIHFK
mgnify:CR=1 FL=1